jgi:hypothetical protein
MAGRFPYINYDVSVDGAHLVAYDPVILHPEAGVPKDLRLAREAGNDALAYLSVVEVAPDAPYGAEVGKRGIPILGKNAEWGSSLVDIRSPKWRDLLIGELARDAQARGFNGFFLDTAESIVLLAARTKTDAGIWAEALAALVKDLRAAYPDARIVINRGFPALPGLVSTVDAVLLESYERGYDFSRKKYVAVSDADREWMDAQLKSARDAGLPIYAVDFVDPNDEKLARDTADKLAAKGFRPLITTPDLMGRVAAPMRPFRSEVLVVHGRDGGGSSYWPADTWAAQYFQLPLEWLGYQVVYHDVNQPPPRKASPFLGAVMFDGDLVIKAAAQAAYLDWAIVEKARGTKMLFVGQIPFEGATAKRFAEAFAVKMEADRPDALRQVVEVRAEDAGMIGFETPAPKIHYPYRSVQAPEGSRISLSVNLVAASGAAGEPLRHDPVFVAPWGGVALSPYVRFERPDRLSLWVIEPFAFLQASLAWPNPPAADSTTRSGLRLFFSHFDADGFGQLSTVAYRQTAAEVIRDRVLKVYPLPMTASVITSEILGRLEHQKPGEAEKLQTIAKDIFSLPNIQIASHTYSHPFYWLDGDKTAGAYEERKLALAEPYRIEGVDPAQEVTESVKYIDEHLCPPGKKTKLVLWSGNCRPGPESLALAEKLGIENMNGGETTATKLRPSVSAVAPRVMPWGDYLQVFTGQQNEMLYTSNFTNSRKGGFVNVIDTFKRTGEPRRLKPVNIYFHLFAGSYPESLKALTDVFEWAVAQPFHAIPAADYARLARAAHKTRVFEVSDRHWVVAHPPIMQTLRRRADGLVPDMARSTGVRGFNQELGEVYITLGGNPRTELVLADEDEAGRPPHPRLVTSSGPIHFEAFGPKAMRFVVDDFRPVRVRFGGLTPGSSVSARVNEEARFAGVDAIGEVLLDLPARARVSLEF